MVARMKRSALACALALSWTSPLFATPLDDALARRCTVDRAMLPATRAALDDPRAFEAATLRALTEREGLPAPAVHAVVLRANDPEALARAVGGWLDGRAVSPALSRCAWSRQDDLVAVALAPRVVTFERTPGDGPATRRWRFMIPAGVSRPRVVITAPDGRVREVEVSAEGVAQGALNTTGTHVVQLMAEGATGPSPFALWHEDVSGSVGARPSSTQAGSMSASAQVLVALNVLRREAGLAPLRRDPLLDRVASEYAQRIAAERAVAHTPSPGDSPVERLAGAHITAERVAENIARAPELALAHTRLVASPAHRANILDASLDAVGFGVTRSSGSVYLVELFAARPSLRADAR